MINKLSSRIEGPNTSASPSNLGRYGARVQNLWAWAMWHTKLLEGPKLRNSQFEKPFIFFVLSTSSQKGRAGAYH